jgi:hypothetical protein
VILGTVFECHVFLTGTTNGRVITHVVLGICANLLSADASTVNKGLFGHEKSVSRDPSFSVATARKPKSSRLDIQVTVES